MSNAHETATELINYSVEEGNSPFKNIYKLY